MTSYKPLPGEVVWHELMTIDVDRAVAFYSALFDWKVSDFKIQEQTFKIFGVGERMIGGFSPMKEGNIPSHWMLYQAVDDVDQTVEKVSQLGGRVIMPPTDVPPVGRWAEVADSTGATFSPFRDFTPEEYKPRPQGYGVFCWYEVATNSLEKTSDFYAKLYGWTTISIPNPSGGNYAILRKGETDMAGLHVIPEGAPYPPHWLPYIHVEDVNTKTAKAKELGGSVILEPTAVPGMGIFSVISDPTGGVFAMWQVLQ